MASDSAPLDRLVGEVVDERWKLVDKLGAGGMGVVYRAERVKLGKAVAVKFLDERAVQSDESVARFEREARAISRLQHRHCVSILDFGVWRHRPYIVMEYVAGRPLNREMGKAAMTPARGVRIMRQILEALRHAHAAGVVHRDLKPDNVMLTESTGAGDFVKLLDFGLARIISVDEPTISAPKMVAGTPSYMSPEQARGEKADHRTDIYSAGIILYGMCTGRKPFQSDDSVALLRMHMNAAPVPPRKAAPARNISPALEKVILRALEKERDARYYHADEFLAALETVPEAREALEPRRWVRVAGVGAAAVLVMGAVAAGWGGHAWRAAARARPAPTLAAPSVAATASAPPNATAPRAAATAPRVATDAVADLAAPPLPAVHDAAVAPAAPPAVTASVAPSAAVSAPVEGVPPATAPAATPLAAAGPPSPSPPPSPPPSPSPSASPGVAAALSTRDRVEALLASDQLAEAERLLLAEAILQPRAGWVHLQLGEIYFRRIWRRDAEREWTRALLLDPTLRTDARLGERLCVALGAAWSGAGQRIIVRHLGVDAVAPLTSCIRTTDELGRMQSAARLIERIGGPERLDRSLVAARTAALSRRH